MAILVVEDEYLIADDLSRDLARHGGKIVGPFATIDQATAALAASRLDLAVLDINLRGEPVFPLADALSARNIPFVFATGYHPDAIPARFADVPRHEKPVRLEALLETLDRLMQSGHQVDRPPVPGPGNMV